MSKWSFRTLTPARLRWLPFAAAMLCYSPAIAADRVALLIGNGGYANTDFTLRNPQNDVQALDAALSDLGFDVRAEVDLTRDAIVDSLEWLQNAANGAEIAMIFYAGHAVQVGTENLAIGVELETLSSPALDKASVSLSDFLAAIESAGADLSMVIFDACRDNPLGAAQIGTAGLLPVSGGLGTLVAYSTDPGNVATDGTGDNSTFTAALLDHLATPGIDVRLMFGRVRQDVVRETAGLQIPWVEEAVIGEYYLSEPPAPLSPDDEVRVWEDAVARGTIDSYSGYLGRFPDGLYRIVARLRIDDLQGIAPESVDLADDQLPAAMAALEMLGYAVPGVSTLPDGRVRQAFALWQSSSTEGDRTFESLMREAARTATFVGTYTAGILKNDLQRYASVTEALRAAQANLVTAETDFGDNEAAQAAIQSMRREVGEIAQIHQAVAADLDASRTYYSDLIVATDQHLSDWMTDEAKPRFASSRGITRLSDRALADAQTFQSHVRLAGTAPEGSYAWLAALMKDFN
ncbi:caspase family protein [Meridianimarinicoccus aquatilis]|uniref:Caspase family protein n=1 Tax=Meridianimarinicoccus aquatilis TaxID=2552766 RepID=A0A4R6ASC9_9RHOB|nr:caspase family protein [Fluviibacterium aquatile]TDL84713.1 caspase family protein [Fluviibacterium aquatile]